MTRRAAVITVLILLAVLAFALGCVPATGPQSSGAADETPADGGPHDGDDTVTRTLAFADTVHTPPAGHYTSRYPTEIDLAVDGTTLYAAMATGLSDPGSRVLGLESSSGLWSVEADTLFVDYRAVAGYDGALYVAGGSPEDGSPKTYESDAVRWRPPSATSWESYTAPSGVSKDGFRIYALTATSTRRYMGTSEGLFGLVMNQGSLTAERIAPSVNDPKTGDKPDPRAKVRATGLAATDSLLVAAANYVDDTVDSGVIVWIIGAADASNAWHAFGTAEGLPSQNALDVAVGGTTLYVGTDAGLARAVVDPADIASASFETIMLESAGAQPVVHAVHVAADGVVYAATSAGLWCSQDGVVWEVIRRGSGLPDDGSLATDEFVSIATVGDRVFAAMPGVGILELAWH